MNEPSPEVVDDSTSTPQGTQWDTPHPGDDRESTEQTSPTADNASDQAAKPSLPMQKRRRVTRACDECRRKKIKCDGKQPCTHCTVYTYECTYDQPSNRRRNAGPQYVEALENKLKRAEALLCAAFRVQHIDLDDPELEKSMQNGSIMPFLASRRNQGQQENPTGTQNAQGTQQTNAGPEGGDSHLESMVKATGQLDLDEEGYWDYHGHSSGLSFIRRMKEQFGDDLGVDSAMLRATPFIKSRPMSQIFDSPRSNHTSSPGDSTGPMPGSDLPSKAEALQLCDNGLNDASALLCVVHQPTFYKMVDRMYDKSSEDFGNEENKFLPLLYAVMALGSLFAKDYRSIDSIGYENAIEEGFKYFKASRQLMDIADCRDLTSLQAILYMILFLQSSAKLSTCYAYIGVALRSALRLGLHRAFNDNFNPIEAECRKRAFWVVRKMDTYVGALLGLPHTMNDEDIDQDYPIEVADEYITETEVRPMPEGIVCQMMASNAHTKLVHILAKIVRHIYPIKSSAQQKNSEGKPVKSYSVSYTKIREIEKDLLEWEQQLPIGLKPGGEVSQLVSRLQQLLRIAFAHAQMMLYRPFLHYVSNTCRRTGVLDKRTWACASKCVTVSRNIIHITAEMKKRCLLVGAYWFTMYTTFFAILSLVFFALENPENPTSHEVLRDAFEGRDLLAQLAKRSMAADRCTATLEPLFHRLPERLQRGREMSITSKKRRQESSPSSAIFAGEPSSYPGDLASQELKQGPKRASTFPQNIQLNFDKRSSVANNFSSTYPHLPLEFNDGNSPNRNSFIETPGLTPNSASSVSFNTPQQQRFNSPITTSFPDPAGFNQALPDLSAMMFPSNDPFAYPTQPRSSSDNSNFFNNMNLQDNQHFLFATSPTVNTPTSLPGSSKGIFQISQTSAPTPAPGFKGGAVGETSNNNNDLDVQLFGPLPMYMMQGDPQQQQAFNQLSFGQQSQNQRQQGGNNSGLSINGMSTVNRVDSVHQNDNSSGLAVNLDQLFTDDDWNGASLDSTMGMGWGTNGMMGMGMR